MACNVEPAQRKSHVQRIVRESIQATDSQQNPPPTVTQDTILGPSGIGHGPLMRKKYHAKIKARLAVDGCAMRTLTPESFTKDDLKRVRDVTEMVLADLGDAT